MKICNFNETEGAKLLCLLATESVLLFNLMTDIIMAKGQVQKASTKKPPQKTAKEKKQEKQAKKAAKDK